MNPFEFFFDAFRNLASNKLRSGLTMMGVIIGVAAVIAMSSIVDGGKQLTVEMIEKMGTNLLSVRPKTLNDEERQRFSGRSDGLRYSDVEPVATDISFVKDLTPVVNVSARLRHADQYYDGRIEGVQPSYRTIRNHDIDVGRFLSDDDLAEYKKVVVLGREVAKELFGNADPIGQDVKVDAQRFVVIGILEEKGSLHGINYDETILIPVTTAMKLFRGNDQLSSLIVKVEGRHRMKQVEGELLTLLLSRHDGVEDFSIRSQDELIRNTEMIIFTFRVILGGTAALALLVGGIGIMNIMLVTVSERTAEIGLRKALGASRRAILVQFLIESAAISLFGGAIGVVFGGFLGLGFGWFAERAITGWNAVILPEAVVLGFFFALGIGIVFGLYPALRAARLDPADALRYR
jgi:putative ABC transport system permease protein